MSEWKRNLVFIWLSQFLSIAGFMLALPFSPFFIQELGVTDPDRVKVWSGICVAAPSFGLAVTAPIWGVLADRFGRKPMMLRANFGAVVVLTAMGFSPNVWVFLLLRVLQGFFTGTMNAAMTFVASYSPRDKQGFALGTLSTAVYAGSTAGPFFGGFLADACGYKLAFVFSGMALLLASALVLFGVREQFVPPTSDSEFVPRGIRGRILFLGPGIPILLLLVLSSFALRFDQAILPLYIQDLHGSLKGASRLTGAVVGVGALGAVFGGLALGRLADRISAPRVGKISALAAGVFQGAIGLAPSFFVLYGARFLMAFCAAGLDPVFLAWLSRVTPEEKRGRIFGWSVTARCIGWGLTPLASAAVAVWWGFASVFLVGAASYALLLPAVGWVSAKVQSRQAAESEEARSQDTPA